MVREGAGLVEGKAARWSLLGDQGPAKSWLPRPLHADPTPGSSAGWQLQLSSSARGFQQGRMW